MLEVHSELLWIGHAFDLRNPRTLMDHDIAAIVDVAYEEPVAQVPRHLIYCRFPIIDGEGNDLGVLQQAVKTTCALLTKKVRTMVACSAGMSRSPAIAAVALAILLQKSPHDVLLTIGDRKPLDVSAPLWEDLLSTL